MDWIKNTRTLVKELSSTKHPGSRIKLIRIAKNRSGDSKGKFGERDFVKSLVEEGAIGESETDRKVYKRFESGQIKLRPDKEPVPTVLRLLEITPEFAGYVQGGGPEEDSPRSTNTGKAAKKAKLVYIPLQLVAHNHLEDQSIALLVTYDPTSNKAEVHIFGNERPDQSVLPEKFPDSFSVKELWLREQLVKFGDSSLKEQRQVMPGRARVEL